MRGVRRLRGRMIVKVSSIADHPDFVPIIANWHFQEWGHLTPGASLEAWTSGLAQRTRPDSIPTTFVASAEGEPIGSAVLVEHDMSSRPDLSPWLAGVYVVPNWRGCGVGSLLVQHATGRAAEFGVERLYLYTRGNEEFYGRLGWSVMSREEYEGREVTIMKIELTRAVDSDESAATTAV
jgi:GNAT superfamily N-acetyltransferase